MSTVRLSLVSFAIDAPGSYVLRIGGLDAAVDYSRCRIVFTRDTSVHAAGHGVTAADSDCRRGAGVFSTRKSLEPVFGSTLHAAAASQSAAPVGSAIWVIGRDGHKAHRITRGTADYQPAWSPDGRKVVFARFHNDVPSLYVMDANGKQLNKPRVNDSKT